MHRFIAPALVLSLGACATSDDPADGGFFSGVRGIATGSFDQRIADREGQVAAEEARQAALQSELAQLQGDYAALRAQLASLRAQAQGSGKPIPADLSGRVNTALSSTPGGATDAERIANLRRAISDARGLAGELSKL